MFFLITVLSLIALYNVTILDKNTNVMENYNNTLKLIEDLQKKSNSLIIAEKDKETRFDQKLVENYRDFDTFMDEFIKKSKRTISSKELKKTIMNIEKSRENFNTVLNTVYQAYDREFEVWDTAEIPMSKLIQKRESLHKDIEDLLLKNNQILQDMTDNSAKETRIIMAYMIIMIAVILMLVIWFGYYMAKKITYPINQLINAAREIGSGNLDYKVNLKGYDEIGELGQTLNQMALSLKESNEKLKAMFHLAVTVAHEVRNPIAGIGNAIQVISSKFKKDDPYNEIIVEMLKQINRVDEIISNLLMYARPVPIKAVPVKLRLEMMKVLSFIKNSNSYPDVTDEMEWPEDCDPEIMADTKQFTQVFMNVVINAYQALSGVKDARLKIKALTQNDTLSIKISDNGPGIPPEIMNKIFEPFFTTKPKGSGLGLAVSQKIMKTMGGDLAVTTNDSGGATFEISMPVLKNNLL